MVAFAPKISAGAEKTHFMSLVALQRKQSGEDAETLSMNTGKPEIMLFNRKEEFAKVLPTVTAASTPVAEQSKAKASVATPLFDFGRTNPQSSERDAMSASLFAHSGAITSSALTSPEESSGSNDKKDGQNQFVSAGKSLEDLRLEALTKDNILESIMGNLC